MLLAWPVRIERQQLAEQQSAEGRDARGPLQLRPRAYAHSQRQSAPQSIECETWYRRCMLSRRSNMGSDVAGQLSRIPATPQISISARNCSPIHFANSTQLADIEYR